MTKLKNVNIAYLTGTATVVENEVFQDKVIFDRPSRTAGQMFFQPYESTKEFIFCARHTLLPIGTIAFAILDPMVLIAIPSIYAGLICGALLISGFYKIVGNDENASWALDLAETFFTLLCQDIVDSILVPVTTLALITRGISTGLKAAGIYDYDAPEAEASPTISPLA